MAAVVWLTISVAIWHFSIFVPDRFRGGIVGAFLGSIAGGMIVGAIAQVLMGRSIGETDILTVIVAVPGVLLGLGGVYALGVREEEAALRA